MGEGSRVKDGVNGGVAGGKNEGWDRGNVALIALDLGDLIICPPSHLLPPQRERGVGGRERENPF